MRARSRHRPSVLSACPSIRETIVDSIRSPTEQRMSRTFAVLPPDAVYLRVLFSSRFTCLRAHQPAQKEGVTLLCGAYAAAVRLTDMNTQVTPQWSLWA